MFVWHLLSCRKCQFHARGKLTTGHYQFFWKNCEYSVMSFACRGIEMTCVRKDSSERRGAAMLLKRCRAKVAKRDRQNATEPQLRNGVPMFLEQLIRTLQVEQTDHPLEIEKFPGPPTEGRRIRSQRDCGPTRPSFAFACKLDPDAAAPSHICRS